MGSYSGYNLSYNAIDKRSLNTASFRALGLKVLSNFNDKKQIPFGDLLQHPAHLIGCTPNLDENGQVSYIAIDTLAWYSICSSTLNKSSRIKEIYLLEDMSDYFH